MDVYPDERIKQLRARRRCASSNLARTEILKAIFFTFLYWISSRKYSEATLENLSDCVSGGIPRSSDHISHGTQKMIMHENLEIMKHLHYMAATCNEIKILIEALALQD